MIFEVTPEHIEDLSDSDLRILIGYLAEQEVIKQGHSAAGVTYGGHQNATDGGIDVRAELSGKDGKGYVPRSKTGFQVKAEDMPRRAILNEMAPKKKLREAIRVLGEAGGAYIIVSSKGSVSDTALTERKNAMAAAIADEPTAVALHLDFYDRRRVATWVNQHPGLIPWVRSRSGQALSGWQAFGDWSSSPSSIDEDYVLDGGTRLIGSRANDQSGLSGVEGINRLRNILARPKGLVRLVGLSGVGKTRLIQALFDDRVGDAPLERHLAVYTDIADGPDPVPLELLSKIQHLGQRCVLVVDNCGIELHRKLAARIGEASAPVSLISVEYDISDDEPESTEVYRLEPASPEVISKILERRYPELTKPEIGTIAAFSDGNSRIALALAETSKEGGSLANLKDSDLFTRLFRQKNEVDPALLRAAKIFSLVYSFDLETLSGDQAELPILASLAEESITSMHGRAAEMQRRMLIQQRSKWRAVLPHALAHRLAKQALQDIPKSILRTRFIEVAPERLLKSFSRRLGCLHDSTEAQNIVADWLSDGGSLSNIENLDDLGAVLLDNIAPVNPEAVLRSIKSAYERSPTLLTKDHSFRQALVHLLRSLAYDPSLFDDAVELIVCAVGSSDSTNNKGELINVFKSLFYLWLSGTHASIEIRTDFIRKIAGTFPDNYSVIMEALDALLECNWFTSHYSFEFGTRKRDYGLNLRKRVDIQHWYDAVFELCADLDTNPTLRPFVRGMIASHFRELAAAMYRVDTLVALAERFAIDGGWPEGWAGVRGGARKLRKASRPEAASALDALADKLQPASLEQRIVTYVLPAQWSSLDLAELEDVEDEKKYVKANAHVQAMCVEIGAELADDLEALKAHLPAMLDARTNRGYAVISAVAKHAKDVGAAWHVILEDAVQAAKEGRRVNSPAFFVSGLKERDSSAVEALLDEALANEVLHPIFVTMQVSAGVDAVGCDRLIRAISTPSIPTSSFAELMGGRACDDLSGTDFKRLLLAIAGREGGIEVAAEVLHMRVFSRRSDKLPLTEEDMEAGREVLRRIRFTSSMHKLSNDLAQITRACLSPPRDEQLAREMCAHLRDGANAWGVQASDFGDLVGVLGELFPVAVLDVLLERPGPEDGRSLFRSFREHRPCPLRMIDDDKLLEWAHAKPETRFVLLAESIGAWGAPSTIEGDDDGASNKELEWTPAIGRLIREAPDPTEVLDTLGARLHPSAWSGSLTDKLEARLPLLESLSIDADQRIADWATSAIPNFKDQIEKARAWEASMDRERDERFEW